MSCAEARDLLAALSLDALDVGERDLVEEHLLGCPSCAVEQRPYQEAVARLALAFPQHEPPPSLKRRLLTAAAAECPADTPARFPRVRLQLDRPRFRAAAVIAGLALVVAFGTTLGAVPLRAQLNEQRSLVASLKERAARYDTVVAVLQAPDLQVRPMQGTPLAPQASGRIYVDPETGAGMIVVQSLPPLSEGRVYQLWWVRADGTRASGGLLTRTDQWGNGYALIQSPSPLGSWRSARLTEEPLGGSPAPTGLPLLSGST